MTISSSRTNVCLCVRCLIMTLSVSMSFMDDIWNSFLPHYNAINITCSSCSYYRCRRRRGDDGGSIAARPRQHLMTLKSILTRLNRPEPHWIAAMPAPHTTRTSTTYRRKWSVGYLVPTYILLEISTMYFKFEARWLKYIFYTVFHS